MHIGCIWAVHRAKLNMLIDQRPYVYACPRRTPIATLRQGQAHTSQQHPPAGRKAASCTAHWCTLDWIANACLSQLSYVHNFGTRNP